MVAKIGGQTAPDGSHYVSITDGFGNAGSGSAGAVVVEGNVASGATDSGNPVKVGAKYNVTKPTFTDGQRGDLQIDSRGNLQCVLYSANNPVISSNGGSAADANGANIALFTNDYNLIFNGTNWDRIRGNIDTAALINAAAQTTNQTGADQTNYNGKGVKVVLDMTNAGTGSVTLNIQGKDVASGKYYTILSGAAVTTNSTNVYEIYPGLPATANVSANSLLPRTWRVTTTANNANATTYTVAASVIL